MVSTAALAAGNMHPNPMAPNQGFGVTAYTCFQMIQTPNIGNA